LRITKQTIEPFDVLASVYGALTDALDEEIDVGIIRVRELPKSFVTHKEVAQIVPCGDPERFQY